MELIVLTPTRGILVTEAQEALEHELINNQQYPMFLRTVDMPIPICRNYLVEKALKLEWTHALLMDDDVVLPEGGLKAMIKLNTDIAVMDYPLHSLKDKKGCGTMVTNKRGDVLWAGLGATLVKREVFEKVPKPWFVNTNYKIARLKNGDVGFYPAQSDQNKFSGGEDVYFFLQAKKLGFDIKHTEKTARHAHIKQMVTAIHNNRYQEQHQIVYRDKIETELI